MEKYSTKYKYLKVLLKYKLTGLQLWMCALSSDCELAQMIA